MKTCTKCRIPRELTNFVGDRNRPDGKYPICKGCRSVYYRKNGERIRSKMKEYRRSNLTLVLQKQKEYVSRRFFHTTARNLKQRSEGSCATYIQLARLWRSQRGLCAMTARKLTRNNAQLDHIVPITKGGSGDILNLRWVHRDVNYAKRDLMDAEFIALCQSVISVNNTKQVT